MRTLNVGCGFRPCHDVNVDLFPQPTFHRDHFAEDLINTEVLSNFVRADGQYLPFKDGSFDLVVSAHTMEHVSNPFLFLRELIRVSRLKIRITVPHRYRRDRPEAHINYFSGNWFHKALRNYMHAIEVKWKNIPHDMFPLFRMPEEMTVIIHKDTRRSGNET